MIPVFVKGNIKFTCDGREYEFLHQNISSHGITGHPWGALNPKDHFGRKVVAMVQVLTQDPFTFRTEAVITREQSLYAQTMGLRFNLSEPDRARLHGSIQSYGTFPTDYIRKYPRIPAMNAIQIFPMRAIVTPVGTEQVQKNFSFDVKNLSPNGALFKTENQAALLVAPGTKLGVVLEPRGWFPMPIHVQGTVCRVSDEIADESENIARYFGVKFSQFDEVNRLAYVDLLKEILERFKSSVSA